MLNYPFIFPKVWGYFKKRINRFVVEVAVNGRIEQAHLANPGRLWELFLPETELLLSPAQPGGEITLYRSCLPKRRTKCFVAYPSDQ